MRPPAVVPALLGLLLAGGARAQDADAAYYYFDDAEPGTEAELRLDDGIAYRDGLGVDADYARALSELQRAADLGLVEAEVELAAMWQFGLGVPRNMTVAARLLGAAAVHEDPPALVQLAIAKSLGLGVARDAVGAVRRWRQAHRTGDPEGETGRAYRFDVPLPGSGEKRQCSLAALGYQKLAQKLYTERSREHPPPVPYVLHELDMFPRVATEDDVLEYDEHLAEAGSPEGLRTMGVRYLGGEGVPVDRVQARNLLQAAVDQGDNHALYNLGFMEFTNNPPNNRAALRYFEQAAEAGVPAAHNGLASLYFNGDGGVPRNYTRARLHFQKAAQLGQTDAFINLAIIYQNGLGVDRDYDRAFEYLEQALDFGNSKAMFQLGLFHWLGLGSTKKSCNEAVVMFKSFVEEYGSVWPLLEEAFAMYDEDDDPTGALFVYMQAAELGSVIGQLNAAWLLHTGAVDPAELSMARSADELALYFYNEAAAQRDFYAELRLGDFHYHGWGGLAPNYTEAYQWYARANDSSSEAIFNMAFMHERGLGVWPSPRVAEALYRASMAGSVHNYVPGLLATVSLYAKAALPALLAGAEALFVFCAVTWSTAVLLQQR